MKKLVTSVSLLLTLTILLCSCSGSAKPLSEIFSDIKEEVTFRDFNEFKDVSALDKYYGITEDMVSEFAGGINSTGVNQEEVVLIKAKDNESANKIREALQKRYEAKLNQNKNYNPEQAKLIEDSAVETPSNLNVCLIISENREKIKEIYLKALGVDYN